MSTRTANYLNLAVTTQKRIPLLICQLSSTLDERAVSAPSQFNAYLKRQFDGLTPNLVKGPLIKKTIFELVNTETLADIDFVPNLVLSQASKYDVPRAPSIMNLLVQGRCSNSSQCHFYENCVEHFTGQCLGQCELSSWFTHVILWFVFSFLLVFVICIKCDCWCCRMIFCANYRQMHRHQPYRFSRRSTPMNIPGIGKQHQTNSPSINMSTFHEIVLARNLSNDQY